MIHLREVEGVERFCLSAGKKVVVRFAEFSRLLPDLFPNSQLPYRRVSGLAGIWAVGESRLVIRSGFVRFARAIRIVYEREYGIKEIRND